MTRCMLTAFNTNDELNSISNIVVCVCCHRNTATETVDQELLFTGNENGKLVALRNIIKKVCT